MSTQFSGLPVRPFKAPPVNAGTSLVVEYSVRDYTGTLAEPTLLRYRIDNLTDVIVVQDWVEVEAPASEGVVTIAASLNAMSRQYRDRQHNQITFEATLEDGSKTTELCAYQLCAVYTGQGGG